MKVYHHSIELIIIDKPLFEDSLHRRSQQQIINAVGGGIKTMYNAHEIWTYNSATHRFDAYKNKNTGNNTLLKAFFADKGIHIRCDAASLNTAAASACRFEDDKDHFLFQLIFGN